MTKYIMILVLLVLSTNAQNRGDFCGTAAALKDFQEGKLPQRPPLSGPVEYIDETNFRIHFTRQGSDAVTLAYAESTASALEYSWAKLVDILRWVAPPPDNNIGGDNRYDVYIKALSQGVAGSCHPEYSYPDPYPNGVSSHIRIDRNLDNNSLKATVCHEFAHAIQFRYSSVEGTWWMENCAVYLEDIVYDDINDYLGYLSTSPSPLNSPHLSLTTGTNLYWYAGAIWAMFLGDCYGNDCLRQIWTYQGQIAGQNALTGIDYILSTHYSSSLVSALKQYAVWRYFTGTRADTVHFYKEGYLMPLVQITQSHNSYPASGNQSSYPLYNPGGAGYVQFLNGGGKLFVNFDAQSVYRWGCFVIGYRPYNSIVYELRLNTSAAGSDSFFWQDNEHFALIPVATQWEWNTGGLSYTYSANLRIVHDVGVVRLTGIPTNVDSGAVVFAQALVKNYGLSQENFPVRLAVGNSYTNTQNLFLNPGDSILVTFPACTLIVRNYNTILCTTLLVTDERPTNNSIQDRIFVRVKDVATIAIIEPQASVNQGSFIHPKARIKNYGNVREIFYVDFMIGNWQTTQRLSLAGGLEFSLEFDSIWNPADTGHFTVKCSTKLANDVNHSNDWMTSICYVHPAAVAEENKMYQIQLPSIAFNSRMINIKGIRGASIVQVELFDMQGRRVYYEKSNQHNFALRNNFASGCYILRIRNDNNYSIYKGIIIRK